MASTRAREHAFDLHQRPVFDEDEGLWLGSSWAAQTSGYTWEADDSFAEVPECIFGGEWQEVAKGPWHRGEHITLLEVRACLHCLQQAVRSGDVQGQHLVVLGDNLGCVLAVDRSRAGSFEILSVIRKISALCILHRIRLHIRWIHSERNASDKASRHFDPETQAGTRADTVAHVTDVQTDNQHKPDEYVFFVNKILRVMPLSSWAVSSRLIRPPTLFLPRVVP